MEPANRDKFKKKILPIDHEKSIDHEISKEGALKSGVWVIP
jgi:hypothetical protein